MRGGKLCLTISYKFAFIRYAVNLTPGLEYAGHKQRGSIWRDLSKCLHGHMAVRIFRCIICMTPGRYTVRVLVLSPAVGIKYDRRMLMPVVCQIETAQAELTVPHVLQYRLTQVLAGIEYGFTRSIRGQVVCSGQRIDTKTCVRDSTIFVYAAAQDGSRSSIYRHYNAYNPGTCGLYRLPLRTRLCP